MIVVLDTNTLVSSLMSQKGAPYEIIQHWIAEKFDVAVSEALKGELIRVLNYDKVKKYIGQYQKQVGNLFELINEMALFMEPKEKIRFIVDDPDDDRVLECAVEAKATYIISGDKHLLNLEEFRSIIVLSPAEFLSLLALENKA